MCFVFIRDITEGKPLPLEVMGIEYMNDDPSMADVLYAKVNVKDGSDKSVFQRKNRHISFSKLSESSFHCFYIEGCS